MAVIPTLLIFSLYYLICALDAGEIRFSYWDKSARVSFVVVVATIILIDAAIAFAMPPEARP